MNEVRTLMSSKYANDKTLNEIFDQIENRIMSIEYYEIMILFLKSKSRINNLLKQK